MKWIRPKTTAEEHRLVLYMVSWKGILLRIWAGGLRLGKVVQASGADEWSKAHMFRCSTRYFGQCGQWLAIARGSAENKTKQKRLWGRSCGEKGQVVLVLCWDGWWYFSVIYWSSKIASIEFNYPNKRVSPGFEWIWQLAILASDQKNSPP